VVARLLVDRLVDRLGRDDVENGQPRYRIRVVERHAQGDPGAAIVSRDREALEPQCAHHLKLVLGHRALRIRSVITAAWRLIAVAVAAQVRTDDREMLGKHGSHACHMTCVWG
jgi:hypothetical protein